MANGLQNINLTEAKKIVESKGLNFEEFKQKSIDELQLDFLNKRGVYKEIEREHIISSAVSLLLNDIKKKEMKNNMNQAVEQSNDNQNNHKPKI